MTFMERYSQYQGKKLNQGQVTTAINTTKKSSFIDKYNSWQREKESQQISFDTTKPTDPYAKYYGLSSGQLQTEIERLENEGAIFTTRAATNDEIAAEAGRLDKAWSAADSAWLDADAMYQSGSMPEYYTADYVAGLKAERDAITAERDAFYSGLRTTGGWSVTEVTGNKYQDEIDWLTGYKGEVALQESTNAAVKAAQQEIETAKSAAMALESAGLYKGRKLSDEQIAQMDADLSRAASNARSLYETARSGTATSSAQVARYKREAEIAEANYDNFIMALPYISRSSLYKDEYNYINDVGTAREERDSKTAVSKTNSDAVNLFKQGGVQDWRQYTYMTDAEREEYTRLYYIESPYVAAAYLAALTKGALNSRYGQDIAQGNSDAAEIGAQVVYGFKDAVGNIPELWSDTPHDPSAWEYASQYMMDDEDSWVSWLLQKAAHWAGGEVPSWLLKRYTKWFTGNNDLAQLMGDLLGGVISVGEAYEKAKASGYTGTKAQFYGIVEGVSKSMLENQIGLG